MKWTLTEYNPEILADIIIGKLKEKGWYGYRDILEKEWEYWDSSGIQVLCIYSQRISNVGKPNRTYCTILGIHMRKDYMLLKSWGGAEYKIPLNELEPAL